MIRATVLLLVISVTALGGCKTGLMSSRSAKMSPEDEQESDTWVSDAGEYTRKVHPRDEVKDPLHIRNVFTSDKAREIERNLGVGP